MPISINVESGYGRADYLTLNPFDIIIHEEARGRAELPSEQEVAFLAANFHDIGQLQAVICRKDKDNKPILVAGFTRVAAAKMLRTGFTNAADTFIRDENFQVKVFFTKANEEEAFLLNLAENTLRNEVTVIDNVHNWRRLQDRYNKTNAEIAKIYGITPAQVTRQFKLLMLSRDIQRKVHAGELSVSAAITMAEELPEEQHQAFLDVAAQDKEKVTATGIKAHVRRAELQTAEAAEAAAETPKSEYQPMSHEPAQKVTERPVSAVVEQDGQTDVDGFMSEDTAPSASPVPVTAVTKPTIKELPLSYKEVRSFFEFVATYNDPNMQTLGNHVLALMRGVQSEPYTVAALQSLLSVKQEELTLTEEANSEAA